MVVYWLEMTTQGLQTFPHTRWHLVQHRFSFSQCISAGTSVHKWPTFYAFCGEGMSVLYLSWFRMCSVDIFCVYFFFLIALCGHVLGCQVYVVFSPQQDLNTAPLFILVSARSVRSHRLFESLLPIHLFCEGGGGGKKHSDAILVVALRKSRLYGNPV